MLRKMVVLSLVVGLGAFGAGCGDPCEAAAEDFVASYEACGITTTDGRSDGAEVECTDTLQAQLECYAACAAAAPCETPSTRLTRTRLSTTAPASPTACDPTLTPTGGAARGDPTWRATPSAFTLA